MAVMFLRLTYPQSSCTPHYATDAVLDYKAEMKEMYQSGASMYHIAQLYGTDAKTVARWVKQ